MMWLDLTDGTLKRKQTGLNILAEVRELKIRNIVNILTRMRTNVRPVNIPVPSGSDLMAAFCS